MKSIAVVTSLLLFGLGAAAQTDQCIQGHISTICPGDEVAYFWSGSTEVTTTDFSVGLYKGLRNYHPATPSEDDGEGYAEVHLYYHFGTTHLQGNKLYKIVHTCVDDFCPGHEYVYPRNYTFRVLRVFENGDAYIDAYGKGRIIVNLGALSRRISYDNSSASNHFP